MLSRRREVVSAIALAAVVAWAPGGLWANSIDLSQWGISPFSDVVPASGVHYATPDQNDYSPVSYPGIGHVPSPGFEYGGEQWDLEGFYARTGGGNLKVLLVTSIGTVVNQAAGTVEAYGAASGYRQSAFRLGDLFLDVGDDGSWEYAVITTKTKAGNGLDYRGQDGASWTGSGYTYSRNWNRTDDSSVSIGDLYQLSGDGDWVSVVASDRSGYGNSNKAPSYVGNQVNPWVVYDPGTAKASGQGVSMTAEWADFGSPAQDESLTFLYEWTIPLGSLNWDPVLDPLGLQITVECGNDVIQVSVPPVPEPITAATLALALTTLGTYARRRAAARRANHA